MTDLSSSSTPNDNTKSWMAHKAVVTVSDFETGGVYCKFYLGKTDFSLYLPVVSVCLYICTGISLYILIS